MPKLLKILIGLAAALGVGLLAHGPLGRGAAFVDQLDAGLQLRLQVAGVPGVTGTMQREPLARTAILSGPADQFQRDGIGSLLGLDERALSTPGMARVEWTNPPPPVAP